jgi:hypothetical protein
VGVEAPQTQVPRLLGGGAARGVKGYHGLTPDLGEGAPSVVSTNRA